MHTANHKDHPMDLSRNTCSRELAEEMARLGVCQTEPELYWNAEVKEHRRECLDGTIPMLERIEEVSWNLMHFPIHRQKYKAIVSPALVRMMEELPFGTPSVGHSPNEHGEVIWFVILGYDATKIFTDKHLPNACAKALIAIKKGTV